MRHEEGHMIKKAEIALMQPQSKGIKPPETPKMKNQPFPLYLSRREWPWTLGFQTSDIQNCKSEQYVLLKLPNFGNLL